MNLFISNIYILLPSSIILLIAFSEILFKFGIRNIKFKLRDFKFLLEEYFKSNPERRKFLHNLSITLKKILQSINQSINQPTNQPTETKMNIDCSNCGESVPKNDSRVCNGLRCCRRLCCSCRLVTLICSPCRDERDTALELSFQKLQEKRRNQQSPHAIESQLRYIPTT